MKKERLTRSQAIRARCIDCVGGQVSEVRKCRYTDCQLHRYRLGREDDTTSGDRVPRGKAIRHYCLWCMNDSSAEVRRCQLTDCVLHRYRMGKEDSIENDSYEDDF